jgi:alpha-methylacyl-CoA racemase
VKPLDGVRVLDLSRLVPGPFATLVLRDLGAMVDKLEDTGPGDYLRHLTPERAGASVAFHLLNRGKRCARLDLRSAPGRGALERMLPRYDVLLEQFRPGALERVDVALGHDALRARHPRLIVCALTGFGQTGPLASRAGHDLGYLARSGLLAWQGPANGPPQVPGCQIADMAGALWCVIAILGALRERERTGCGCVLDVAMTDGVVPFAPLSLGAALHGAAAARGSELLTGGVACYGTYVSRDGFPVTLAALEPKFWSSFCAAVGMPADPDALRPGPHQPALREALVAVFAARTRAEWQELAASHDCCLEVVPQPDELLAEPQLVARRIWQELPTDDGPIHAFRTPVTPRDAELGRAPRSGEHTREMLREAGLSEAEIDELCASGAAAEG